MTTAIPQKRADGPNEEAACPRPRNVTLSAVSKASLSSKASLASECGAPEASNTLETVGERSPDPASSDAGPDMQTAEFLAKISHEVRTPLSAISGFAEMLQRQQFGPLGHPKYSEYAAHILASAEHALSLLDDLLDLEQIQAGQLRQKMQSFDIVVHVHETLALFAPAAEKTGVDIEFEMAPELDSLMPDMRWSLHADPRAIRQILLNLLSNAVRFSDRGTRVLVSLSRGGKNGLILSVEDTGAGFDATNLMSRQDRAHQNTGQNLKTGHGFGLPLSRDMAEQNGARLMIDSQIGQGTRVSVVFSPEQIELQTTGTKVAPFPKGD